MRAHWHCSRRARQCTFNVSNCMQFTVWPAQAKPTALLPGEQAASPCLLLIAQQGHAHMAGSRGGWTCTAQTQCSPSTKQPFACMHRAAGERPSPRPRPRPGPHPRPGPRRPPASGQRRFERPCERAPHWAGRWCLEGLLLRSSKLTMPACRRQTQLARRPARLASWQAVTKAHAIQSPPRTVRAALTCQRARLQRDPWVPSAVDVGGLAWANERGTADCKTGRELDARGAAMTGVLGHDMLGGFNS